MRKFVISLVLLIVLSSTVTWGRGNVELPANSDTKTPTLVFIEIPKRVAIGGYEDPDMQNLYQAISELKSHHRGVGFFWLQNASQCLLYPIDKNGTIYLTQGQYTLLSCTLCMTGQGEDCVASAVVMKNQLEHSQYVVGVDDLEYRIDSDRNLAELRAELHATQQMSADAMAHGDAAAADAYAYAETVMANAMAYRAEAAAYAADAEAMAMAYEEVISEADANVAAARADALAAWVEVAMVFTTAVELSEGSEIITLYEQVEHELINVDQARLSPAGPDTIYVSGIEYGGNSYSALIEYQGDTSATVMTVFDFSHRRFFDTSLVIGLNRADDISYWTAIENLGAGKFQISNISAREFR